MMRYLLPPLLTPITLFIGVTFFPSWRVTVNVAWYVTLFLPGQVTRPYLSWNCDTPGEIYRD